jgi:multicomponent Na+:H+ antiporter subunit E
VTVLFNLFLALVWCLLTASTSPWNFVAGLLVGAFVVSAFTTVTGRGNYLARLWGVTRFGWYFVRVLVRANVQIAAEAISPTHHQRPRILRYPVGDLTKGQTTFLANTITLTPGTLVVDVSPDGEWLYIHCMFAEDSGEALRSIDELADRLRREVFAR